jgi:hypothetical protein
MSSPPPVSAKQLKMMRHAVGQRWHRNHYCAAKGTEEDALWMLLERAGYAVEFRDGICMRTWHLTEAGQQLVKDTEDVSP